MLNFVVRLQERWGFLLFFTLTVHIQLLQHFPVPLYIFSFLLHRKNHDYKLLRQDLIGFEICTTRPSSMISDHPFDDLALHEFQKSVCFYFKKCIPSNF